MKLAESAESLGFVRKVLGLVGIQLIISFGLILIRNALIQLHMYLSWHRGLYLTFGYLLLHW